MTDLPPDINQDYCEDCGEQGGQPVIPPPCIHESCSVTPLTLDQTGGALGFEVRTRGGSLQKQLDATCDDPEDCGVIRCFIDPENNPQGLDVDLFGDPDRLDGVDCVNPDDGSNLYVNPIRRITNDDGSCSLGALPFPVFDIQCDTQEGCDGFYPPPSDQSATVYENCGPELCTTITNFGCYPMLVVPKLTMIGAEVTGPVTIEYQPNANGEFGNKFPVLSGSGFTCDSNSAGSGETGAAELETAGGGDPSHTHGIADHTHSGPSHSHTINCEASGRNTDSKTIEFDHVTIQAGETYNYCVTGSLRFDDPDYDQGGTVNYGQRVRLCLEGRSIINQDSIAQLEGGA